MELMCEVQTMLETRQLSGEFFKKVISNPTIYDKFFVGYTAELNDKRRKIQQAQKQSTEYRPQRKKIKTEKERGEGFKKGFFN